MKQEQIGIRAVGYGRVSTPGQRDNESTQNQEEVYNSHCEAHGLIKGPFYSDWGLSGKNAERPGLQALLYDAREMKFDYLICPTLTRLGRSVPDVRNIVEELQGLGITIVFVKENIDLSNHYGRFILTVLAGLAELELQIIKERTLGNRSTKWKRGSTFIGKTPYGYKWNKEKERLEVNQAEADIYQRIVQMRKQNMSYLKIALALKTEGIKCRRKFFSDSVVHTILANPLYYGHYILNRHQYDGDKRTGELKPASEHIAIDVQPLISKTEWDALQEVAKFNRAKSKRVSVAKNHWLRDVLVCGECGASVKPTINGRIRKDGSYRNVYACFHRQIAAKRLEVLGRSRCSLPFIKGEEIHDLVWTKIMLDISLGGFYIGKEYAASDLEKIVEDTKFDDQLLEVENALNFQKNELRRKELGRERIFALLETNTFDQNEFHQRLHQSEDEILRIKSLITDFQGRAEILREAKANQAALVGFVKTNKGWLKDIQKDLYNLSPADKKVFVEALVDGKIEVSKGEYEGQPWQIDFRINFNKAVFERLISEGKIKGFNPDGQYSSDTTPAGWPAGEPG